MTHLTDDEANELRRLCEAAGSDVQSKGSILPITAAKLARAAQIMFPALLKQLEELQASIAWVDQLNPSTNYESDGAIVHITFEEFDAMRACLGIRPAHRSKEKSMTVSRRWFCKTVSELSATIARAEEAEADRDGARTALALSNASLTAIVERAQCAERENRELKAAIKSTLWRLSSDQDRSGTVVLLRTVLKDDQK